MSPAAGIVAGILGGGLAATSHATKAGTRMLINTSPEPFSNWTASIMEDLMVFAGLWTALNHPFLFLGLLVAFLLAMVWLLPKIWRLIVVLYRKIARWFGGGSEVVASPDAAGTAISMVQPQDLIDRLERLQRLRDSGALTPEEFAAQKSKLFGESSAG